MRKKKYLIILLFLFSINCFSQFVYYGDSRYSNDIVYVIKNNKIYSGQYELQSNIVANFMKEYDELKNLSIPFDYDIIDRRFSHNGELSLLDVFPDEILSIKSNLELIKSFGIDLKGIKELEKKYVTKLSELTEDFRKSSDIEKLKNLTQRLKELNNTFERTNSKVSKPAA